MGLEPTTMHSHVVQMRYPWSRGTLVVRGAIFLVHLLLKAYFFLSTQREKIASMRV